MAQPRPRNPRLMLLGGAMTALLTAGVLSPAMVDVAVAQENRTSTLLDDRVPSSDPAGEYVNQRLEAAAAASEATDEAAATAEEAPAEPAAEGSTEPALEASGEPAPGGGAEPTKGKGKKKDAAADESAPAESGETAGEPAADSTAPTGDPGMATSLSGSDVVVSSVGESGQVDRPGRRGKGRR